jgi:chaperonin GroEL
MGKWILNGESAQRALGRGARTLLKAIAPTFGPIGRTVVMQRRWGSSSVVNDGFTINRELELPNPFEDIAVRFLEQASEVVRQECGDGTTSTVVLAQAIIQQAQRSLVMGADAMALARGVRKATIPVVKELRKMAVRLEEPGALRPVAVMACKEAEMGAAIADQIFKIGPEGAVVVSESKGRELDLELVKGYRFDGGLLSPHFLPEPAAQEASLDEPVILLTGSVLESVEDILPALERILEYSNTILIIAQDVRGEALAGLVMNKERGNLNVLAVKAPGAGGRQEEQLKDLAAATGATVLPDLETGRTLASIEQGDLGWAKKVITSRASTTLADPRGSEIRIEQRVTQLRRELSDSQTDQYARYLTTRLGSLLGMTLNIGVGGMTDTEAKEKLVRVRNAVAASQEALRSGLLPGGGVGLLMASSALDKFKLDGEEQIGVQILQRALSAPLRLLAENAGIDPAVVVHKIKEGSGALNFDAVIGEIVPQAEAGIYDPAGTVESLLLRAVSAATAMLTVNAIIVDPPEPGPMGERLDMSARYE